MNKFILIHASEDKVEVEVQKSFYCEPKRCYLLSDKENIIEHARTMYQLEKEKNDWIRRYDNLIQGLNYWKQRALMK